MLLAAFLSNLNESRLEDVIIIDEHIVNSESEIKQ